ncbi:polyphosphate kinase [bacterium BMS3Bbin12]|nr:polyphosphate kinase [bacterium BMS3Abin12]GBE47706.1 polyphosphate kinase [bacterium BMS3Bbin12]GBE49942.1 polyphosphate kinase [bacterium BMS3Bbin13]
MLGFPTDPWLGMDIIDLKQPELYFNRELSLLEFNRRVLAQARDEATPLLERLRFLCIASTNLDEFFEIRVAGLKQRVELGAVQPSGPDNRTPQEILKAVSGQAHDLMDEQYRVLNEVLIPRLAEREIRLIRRTEWTEAQEAWVHKYFEESLLPVLSPLGLDPAHPFPRILNKSLNFIVSLEGLDAFGRSAEVAVAPAPRALPRIIQLPMEESGSGPFDFVFLSSVIHAYIDQQFPGMQVTGCYQFRVTRNSDLFVDEEEIDDLLRAVEGELASRRYGAAVRLEVAHDCPEDIVEYLLHKFQLGRDDLYQVNGPVNLNRLAAVCDLVDRPDVKYPGFTSGLPARLIGSPDLFEVLRKQDLLLHHPFESFLPVVDLLRQAAADPEVLAIKQTLYRTGPDSAIVDALVTAAQAGKEVTVVIELRARFDEAANIGLAERLQEAGAHVVYGIVGYKMHAKLILIVRREGRTLRRYTHLGTGNYHPRTARLYTDYGLFTSDPVIGDDIHRIFLQLTGVGRAPKIRKVLASPFALHGAMLERIDREARHAAEGRASRIIVKVNALVEPQVIQALYRASMAGVRVDLIVRGICCLRPGVPGVSERIRVRSVVGRFLEHTRVYYFLNGGESEVFCASADWMDRNFFRRVEACFPIESRALRERVIKELKFYLKDNTQAWVLQNDGTYHRRAPRSGASAFSAQQRLLELLASPG